ncbi:uncharacterized protein H6S33_007557 [Morchella sextelata]|uniref:uncharacterized protein n=1 Tax=Morchella sextelata TaxID=1174677 RepID=UPI001D045B29|nr:uncharacterized protein H6S33_007557 [Morchella sextelata]KAH0603898.1 hypothetical protein H6S33_007557 [Morchella sextelata]
MSKSRSHKVSKPDTKTRPIVVTRHLLPSWREVVRPGDIYMSTKGVTVLTPEQRKVTGSNNPWSPQPAKRRPYLVLDVNQDGTFTAVPITSRAGKGWEELSRKDRLRFLPIGRCPEGISRPVVNLESVTSSWRGESSLLASESLIFLDVIETFRPEAMCGCQGRVSEESLLLAKCESARNQREPQVQGSDSTNPFSILGELLAEDQLQI